MSKCLKKIIVFICVIAMFFNIAQIPARADSVKVITLGAYLDDQQRQNMLDYFNSTGNDAIIITIDNQQEHAFLDGIASAEQIGSRTISCAYIQPTNSGGINVKTSNLTWVTEDMIRNALITSGIQNCNVVASAPFEVSGTGALTGIFVAYDQTEELPDLDPDRVHLANEELILTATLGDEIGQEEASQMIADLKEAVVTEQSKALSTAISDSNTETSEPEKAASDDTSTEQSDASNESAPSQEPKSEEQTAEEETTVKEAENETESDNASVESAEEGSSDIEEPETESTDSKQLSDSSAEVDQDTHVVDSDQTANSDEVEEVEPESDEKEITTASTVDDKDHSDEEAPASASASSKSSELSSSKEIGSSDSSKKESTEKNEEDKSSDSDEPAMHRSAPQPGKTSALNNVTEDAEKESDDDDTKASEEDLTSDGTASSTADDKSITDSDENAEIEDDTEEVVEDEAQKAHLGKASTIVVAALPEDEDAEGTLSSETEDEIGSDAEVEIEESADETTSADDDKALHTSTSAKKDINSSEAKPAKEPADKNVSSDTDDETVEEKDVKKPTDSNADSDEAVETIDAKKSVNTDAGSDDEVVEAEDAKKSTNSDADSDDEVVESEDGNKSTDSSEDSVASNEELVENAPAENDQADKSANDKSNDQSQKSPNTPSSVKVTKETETSKNKQDTNRTSSGEKIDNEKTASSEPELTDEATRKAIEEKINEVAQLDLEKIVNDYLDEHDIQLSEESYEAVTSLVRRFSELEISPEDLENAYGYVSEAYSDIMTLWHEAEATGVDIMNNPVAAKKAIQEVQTLLSEKYNVNLNTEEVKQLLEEIQLFNTNDEALSN